MVEKIDAEEFRSRIAMSSENPAQMFRVLNGIDAQIQPWQWLMEASPFANVGDSADQARQWGRVILYYNAWAESVGRPPLTVEGLARGGANGQLVTDACEAIMTYPVPRWTMTPEQLRETRTEKLQIVLATHVSQVFAVECLERDGSFVPGAAATLAAGWSDSVAAVSSELAVRRS